MKLVRKSNPEPEYTITFMESELKVIVAAFGATSSDQRNAGCQFHFDHDSDLEENEERQLFNDLLNMIIK